MAHMETQRITHDPHEKADPRPSGLDAMMARRRALREKAARHRAACVLWALRKKGVRAAITGSLSDGRFRGHSDVDFLVKQCPRDLKYTIEADMEDLMMGMPFDVIYLDEVRDVCS